MPMATRSCQSRRITSLRVFGCLIKVRTNSPRLRRASASILMRIAAILLSNAAAPVDGKKWSQVQPRGLDYWKRFDEYMQQEPVEERDRMITAMLAPLGIEKGKK